MSRYDGRYDISLSIIHANLRFVREIQTEYKPPLHLALHSVFPFQNKGWHVLYIMIYHIYLCRSCVETSPHSTHPCLTRAQICISQPGYTSACIRVLAQHWLSVTVHVVSVVPVGTCLGTRAIFGINFLSLISYNWIISHGIDLKLVLRNHNKLQVVSSWHVPMPTNYISVLRNYYNSKSSRSFQQTHLEWCDFVGAWLPWSGRLHSTSRGAKQFIYWFMHQFISHTVYIEKYKQGTQGRYKLKVSAYILRLIATVSFWP